MGQKETKFEQPDVQRYSHVVAHFGGWRASKKGGSLGAGSGLRETMQIEMALAAYVRTIQSKLEI